MIGVRVRDWNFFNIHAPSGGNLSYLQSAIKAAVDSSYEKDFLLVGDCNYAPSSIVLLSTKFRENIHFVKTGQATHIGGKEFDYGFTNTEKFSAKRLNQWSDHAPIRFTEKTGKS